MDWMANPEAWIALLTLTVLEIVLGIDNIIFISILSGKLPKEQQPRARSLGLFLAMFTRIALLFSLAWVIGLTAPLFEIFGQEISGRDLILLLGGLFLLWKATSEIHGKLEGEEGHADTRVTPSFVGVLVQIALLDIVFSLDSVITAVGMADELAVMGHRGHRRGERDAGGGGPHQPLCRAPPDGQDAGFVVFAPYRHLAHR